MELDRKLQQIERELQDLDGADVDRVEALRGTVGHLVSVLREELRLAASTARSNSETFSKSFRAVIG